MATDDDDAATLRERVRDLEQTVAQQQDTIQQLMPSRRAILAGGAGLVGGAALTGQASAQSAAGQVGTSSEPVDVEAATVTADSVNTENITGDWNYAGGFAGADADARLDAALADAVDGEVIYLEALDYQTARTISKSVHLIGHGGLAGTGSAVAADWTMAGNGAFDSIAISFGGSLEASGVFSRLVNIFGSGDRTVTVSGDSIGVLNSANINVTFESGTTGGLADGLYGGSTVTDNGTNSVGDVV